ncbi:hypothetical protein EG68_07789 [Paragonimus skrjabini miyazakii]|uniref:Uncharacterized protein n=1 Tax=Paragonimus skrjabini miyazakii TaxID=59628 RepID=A0A8S9YFS7_9TREM|nr:hypothetical protein EG68_07789 [Paragonimus skrjabini miyazakii]
MLLYVDDALFNSMISSMTAAAFAAAKVAGGTTEWFHAQPTADVNDDAGLEESYDDDEGAEDSGGETKPGGLRYRIHQLFERLTSTAVKVDLDDETKNSFVDQESKERVAYMIDSIIAQTSVTLRKVNVRIECQLGLPGLNRASGIALSLAHLHVTNQHQPYQSQPTGDPNHSDETGPSWVRQGNLVDSPRKERPGGDGWSWLWNWAGSRRADPGPNSASAAAAASAGSLSTMLHKNIRLEGLDLFWDLWDTKEQFGCTVSNIRLDQSGAEAAEALGTSFSPNRPNGLNTICPTEDNMVASAKLLTLSGMSTARVNLRCPLLSLTQAKPVGQASAIDFTSAEQVTTWPSFEMRVHLDLGAIVACACPSQFYWLQLFIGQLSHIWQNYTNRKTLVPCSDRGSRPASPESPLVTRPGHHQRMVQVVGNGRVDNNQPSHLFRATASEEYRHLAHQLSESELVDLDLSGQNEDAPLVDSKLFWSCLTTTADSTVASTNNETDVTRTRYYGNPDSPNAYSAGIAPGTTTGEPKFSMTANVLCVTLVAFYEDEPVLGTDATIPTHAQSDLCKSVGPASRRTNMPSGRTYSRIESNNSSVVSESEEDSFLDSSSCPVGSFDSHPTHSDTPTPVATEAPESFTVQTLAALPGPFLFFSRFSGLLPWKSPAEFHNGPNNTPTTRPKHNRSTTSLFDTADTAKPMYIDRSEIDTGKMSPTGWVAHLRRQFAELASPRDHLCLVGGLWHVEISSHLVTTRASESYDCCLSGRLQADRCNRTQVDFSAQLFGVEVSECLFPDESVPDLSSTAGMTIVEIDPGRCTPHIKYLRLFVEILHEIYQPHSLLSITD